ncbi:MAG TPA: RodZ domain-containing protein [Bacillota bacterium]|nr:RodZ domain-containing protein [Bacillota bacterium]
MSELGHMLKEARLKKGLSLEDLHKETKIQKRYLEAIEEGNLDALPGHFYARAFVKSYAEAVGLSTDDVLEHIQPETPSPQQTQEPVKPLRRERKSVRNSGRWLSRALLYLFAVLILFVIYIAISEYDKGPKSSAQPSQGANKSNAPGVDSNAGQTPPAPTSGQNQAEAPKNPAQVPEQSQQAQPTPTATLNYVGQDNNVSHYELAGATGTTQNLMVKVTAKGDCWMRVQKDGQDGERVEEVILTNGMSKQYSFGTQDAWIRMGSAPDVTVEVNGNPIDTSKMPRAPQILWISSKKM